MKRDALPRFAPALIPFIDELAQMLADAVLRDLQTQAPNTTHQTPGDLARQVQEVA